MSESKDAPERRDDEARQAEAPKSRTRADEVTSEIEEEMMREAEEAVDADIRAANNDMEAAAEEPARPWPPRLAPKRSKQEEAQAFFAFTQRLAQELNPGPAADPVPEPPRDIDVENADESDEENDERGIDEASAPRE